MNILNAINDLNQVQFRELNKHINTLLKPAITYTQKPVRCGCKKCRNGGSGHGKYWYGYFSYKGKTHCVYIGKVKKEINPLDVIIKRGL